MGESDNKQGGRVPSIDDLQKDAERAVAHPMVPAPARAAILGLVAVVRQQGQHIQELRELVRPCPCSERRAWQMAEGAPAADPQAPKALEFPPLDEPAA